MEGVVDDKANLVLKANKYRKLARWIGDRETVQRILALADELMQRARALVEPAEEKIRKRARKIWEENGRPAGRDEEFWFQAERELQVEELKEAPDGT
jgi:Protein of unknown function (DUF2934)